MMRITPARRASVDAAEGTRSKLWQRAAVVCAVLLLPLFVAACGGGDDSTGADTGTDTGTTSSGPAPKGDPIVVAGLVNVGGELTGGVGGVAEVLETWETTTNADGGIGGRPVAVEIVDTKGNPSSAAAAARDVVDDASVVAAVIADPAGETPAAKTLSAAGLPVVGGIGFDPSVWGTTPGNKLFDLPQLPNVFGVATSFPASGATFPLAAEAGGYKKIAGADFQQSPTSKKATELMGQLGESLGMTFEGGYTVDAFGANFTAQCLQIVNDGVEYMALTIPDESAARFASDCKTQGYEGAFGASAAIVTPTLYESLPADTVLAGGLTAFPWYADAPPVERYRQAMEDNEVSLESWGRADSTASWASVELLRSALEAQPDLLSGELTRDGVLDAYYQIKNEDLEGLLPAPVTYKRGEPAPAPACFWLYSYENGEFSGSYEPTCPDPSLGVGG